MGSLRENLLQVPAALIAVVFFLLIFSLNWFGHRMRKQINKKYPEKDVALGPAEGSLMGLMGLMLAFSFGTGFSRFENRRQTILEEANILNTAVLRTDLFADSVAQPFRKDLKNYINSRVAYYEAGDDAGEIANTLNEADRCFNNLWHRNVTITSTQENRSKAEQMVPVLISMKNMTRTREAGRAPAIPTLIVMALLILVFVASFISGYGVKPGNRNLLLSFAFALMTTVALYLVMELSRPRQGYINLQAAEDKIVEVGKLLP